jgi:hypothetical protein
VLLFAARVITERVPPKAITLAFLEFPEEFVPIVEALWVAKGIMNTAGAPAGP